MIHSHIVQRFASPINGDVNVVFTTCLQVVKNLLMHGMFVISSSSLVYAFSLKELQLLSHGLYLFCLTLCAAATARCCAYLWSPPPELKACRLCFIKTKHALTLFLLQCISCPALQNPTDGLEFLRQ